MLHDTLQASAPGDNNLENKQQMPICIVYLNLIYILPIHVKLYTLYYLLKDRYKFTKGYHGNLIIPTKQNHAITYLSSMSNCKS